MSTIFQDKRILLGVCGSIACYKAAELASRLAQAGALVEVILTQSALEFITPLTFQSVTGRKAFTDQDLWGGEGHVLHIGLAKSADLLIVAPATANSIAKLTHGIADNLLSVTAMAAECPTLVAPAMDGGMYRHQSTQANLEVLKHRGVHLIGPQEGHLASGQVGIGRMSEALDILGQARFILSRNGALKGRKVIVTAGPTQESIDPVRMITNRSSGKQGFAMAQAALDLGAHVSLVSGPVHLNTPTGAIRIDIITAQEMKDAVFAALPDSDVLIMAAAVSDYAPHSLSPQKIKKDESTLDLNLERTIDILQSISDYRMNHGKPRLIVGFAAESQALIENARSKLKAKDLDLMVANDVTQPGAGFSVDTNQVTILYKDGEIEHLPMLDKTEVARMVMERVVGLLHQE